MARRRIDPAVTSAINAAAQRYNIPASWLNAFARVESNFNPREVTGSMSGLFQVDPRQFRNAGGRDVFDPHENAMFAARQLAAHSRAFEQRYNRPPSAHELYMIHQQGWGGAQAHLDRPTRLAWQSMASTAEGRRRDAVGPIYESRTNPNDRLLWSQAAIERNLPPGVRDWRTVTSGDFTGGWQARLERAGIPRITDPQLVAAQPTVTSDPGTHMSPQDEAQRLATLSDRELTRMAGPRRSIFEEMTGATPNMEVINESIPAPIVQSPQATVPGAGGGWTPGTPIFGGSPGAAGIGRALSAAGQAIARSGPQIPALPDPARQMAALDAGAAWPAIPVRPRRSPPRLG